MLTPPRLRSWCSLGTREGKGARADGLFCLQVSLFEESSLRGARRGSACGSRAVRGCLFATLSCLLHDPGSACRVWFQSWEATDRQREEVLSDLILPL